MAATTAETAATMASETKAASAVVVAAATAVAAIEKYRYSDSGVGSGNSATRWQRR